MTLHRVSFVVAIVLFALGGRAYGAAAPEPGAYPERPIRFIVPFPPGGSNDVLARYVGIKLSERIGQQVVIDNRGGANGIIGTQIASTATADGYTILIVSTSYTMNAAVRKLPYDVLKSFDPISTIGKSPNSIVVKPGFVGSLKELVERAKAKPGQLMYAMTGVGGFNHFGGELFKKVAGINMGVIAYRGGGPAMTDVIAGNVPVMFSSVTQVLPHVRAGRLKVVAVGAKDRVAPLPDVPTVSESGYPGYEVYVWWGISAPAGIPKAIRGKLYRDFRAILNDAETKKRLAMDAAEPISMEPEEMRALIRDEVKKWSEVAKVANIRVD